MPRTLWILTEERPKEEVVRIVINKFLDSKGIPAFQDPLRIVPVIDGRGYFTSEYVIQGVTTPALNSIRLKIITGTSSFVDYLVYFQDSAPLPDERPVFAIEETKTDDKESRNTGVYQRATKFVYIDIFYPDVNKTMLYNYQTGGTSARLSSTNIFGSRCLMTLGVEFIGKTPSNIPLVPFTSVEELIEAKSVMRSAPTGNVPINIIKVDEDLITVSGRLVKSGRLAHDPNIGALSLICATLRKLGWQGQIRVISHGLTPQMVMDRNKFVQVAEKLSLELVGIPLPKARYPDAYWRYEVQGEKLVTIFLHLAVEAFTNGRGFAIYDNHAGGERGYFRLPNDDLVTVTKYEEHLNGTPVINSAGKKVIIPIPDLVLRDRELKQLVNVEGEMTRNVLKGISQLNGFAKIEQHYFAKYYPDHLVLRTVVLQGGNGGQPKDEYPNEVSLLIDVTGQIFIGVNAPEIIVVAIKNLLQYWSAI